MRGRFWVGDKLLDACPRQMRIATPHAQLRRQLNRAENGGRAHGDPGDLDERAPHGLHHYSEHERKRLDIAILYSLYI